MTKSILVTLFILFLIIPATDIFLKLLPEYPLKGATQTINMPSFSVKNWLNSSWQKTFEKLFTEKLGGRSILVRTENQLNFSLFSYISANAKDQLIKGKEDWLYENSYIQCWLLREEVAREKALPYLQGFKELQDLLAAQGKTMIMVISPSKPHIYPEHLPDNILQQKDYNKTDNYSSAVPLLQELGINYIDAPEIFKAQGKEQMLFPKGGTHWSYYGASLVMKEILAMADRLNKKKDFPVIKIASTYKTEKIIGTDNDLGELINIWSSQKTVLPMTYAKLEVKDSEKKANLLFVGSSFVLTLEHLLDYMPDYFPVRDILYYYSRLISDAGEKYIDTTKFDIRELIRKNDLIIFEINQSMVPITGWFSFIRDALIELKKDSP